MIPDSLDWRSTGRRCRILLLFMALTCLAWLNPLLWALVGFFGQNRLLTESANFSRPTLSQAKSNQITTWKPDHKKVQALLDSLQLSENQRLSLLPLTLHGPDVISNDSICITDDASPVDILFIVHTAPWHFSRRLQMRRTFVSEAYFKPVKVRTVFLLGLVKNASLQESLEEEHSRHGDLLQGNFLDSYHNLSHKGVLGFRWITRHCPRVGLVVKLDDDVFFDTFKLLHHYWPLVKGKTRSIFCKVWVKPRVKREGKHQMNLFPQTKFYPWSYCSGMAVLMTGDLVPSLFEAAKHSPVFWIDDIYLFGILPAIASHVKYYDVGHRAGAVSVAAKGSLDCMIKYGRNCSLLVTLAEEADVDQMWSQAKRLYSDQFRRRPKIHESLYNVWFWLFPKVHV